MITRLLATLALFTFTAVAALAETYFIDFASGNDTNPGTSERQAWKHAPGDVQATGRPASVALNPGDTLQFKGGVVYRGSIELNAGGEPGSRLTLSGTGWGDGKAIIDGSDLIAGWRPCRAADDAGGNPNYRNLYYAYVPAERSPFLVILHETSNETGEDRQLYLAQAPNPEDFFFFNRRDGLHPVRNENLTLNSVRSPEFFTQTDENHWTGASILIWINPNWTIRKEIKAFSPREHEVILESPLKSNAIYPDGRDQAFAIYNSPHAIDVPGEYAVMPPNADGMRRVVLWPHHPDVLDKRISGSVRRVGIAIGAHNHVEICGFEIRKFGSDALREGNGILAYAGSDEPIVDLIIRDNFIHANKHGSKGYGGIYAHNLRDSRIEGNTVSKNPLHAGIFLSSCEDTVIQGNRIQYTGNTALRLYTCERIEILNNVISHIYATHANGLTLYLGCYDVLVANNFIVESTTPITHQSSGNLYFINNVTDGQDRFKNVNEWPLPSGKRNRSGEIVYLNNTFVNAGSNVSLSLGRDDNNEYIVMNNILDGMIFSDKNDPVNTVHAYNLYVGRSYAQKPQYGWSDGEGEVATSQPLSGIFVAPNALNFRLAPDSPAIGTGTDVTKYYPTDIFPNFDFRTDITGATRTGSSVGAYTE